MKEGRSKYTFQLNCDPNLINSLIQSYIQGNQYELQSNNGEQQYKEHCDCKHLFHGVNLLIDIIEPCYRCNNVLNGMSLLQHKSR